MKVSKLFLASLWILLRLVSHQSTSVLSRSGDLLPTNLLHKDEPDLPSEDTPNQQVLDGFLSLRAQGTRPVVSKVVALKPVRGPAATENGQPEEKFATWQCSGFT
jgi:hypothetical protein